MTFELLKLFFTMILNLTNMILTFRKSLPNMSLVRFEFAEGKTKAAF